MLKSLRDRGLKAVIFEAGNDTGGTWRWNVSRTPQALAFVCLELVCLVKPIPTLNSYTLHSLCYTRKQTTWLPSNNGVMSLLCM